jgi:hypothetical protein
LEEKPENCRVLNRQPILTAAEQMRIRGMKKPHLPVETFRNCATKTRPSAAQ